MKFFQSLDPKDRRMLWIVFGLVAALLVLLAVFTPGEDPNQNNVPDSTLVGQHGAKAAFTLLQQTGYNVQRSEQPLTEIANQAAPGTVLILAEPDSYQQADSAAIARFLQRGGRVLATGLRGGLLLPGNEITVSRDISFAACEAQPDGLSTLAGPSAGSIWIIPNAGWKETRPEMQSAYACAGQPVVVQYPVGNGTAIWWASSTPLENGSITRGSNLELLLNSIGPPTTGQRVLWDESLHNPAPTQWDYVRGPVWPLLLFGSLGFAILVVFSFSRRSGPIRPLPQTPRTTPIEFLEALGALYRSTGANSTALQIAWERFRSQAALITGQRNPKLSASELTGAIERRFGSIAKSMEKDLLVAEEACFDESIKPRRALAIVQSLRQHEETLRNASSHRTLDSAKGAPLYQPGATPQVTVPERN
jgi:hypothetical protein